MDPRLAVDVFIRVQVGGAFDGGGGVRWWCGAQKRGKIASAKREQTRNESNPDGSRVLKAAAATKMVRRCK